MSVHLSRCVKCGTRLDLRRVEPGKTITCPRCGTVLRKPVKAAPEPDPEPPAEATPVPAVEAEDVAPAAPSARPAARAGASRTAVRTSVAGRRAAAAAAPAKKGPSPMLLIGVGAGVVLLGIVGFVVVRNSGRSSAPAPVTPPANVSAATPASETPKASTTPESASAAVDKKAEAAKSARNDYLRRADDADSFDEHLALADWCEREGLAVERRRELERALVYNPKSKDANQKIGNVLYKPSEELLNSTVYDRDLDRFAGRWITAEEQASVAKIEGELKAKAKALQDAIAKDPWQGQANTVVRNVKNEPALKKCKLWETIQKPYVVFVEDDDPAVARQLGADLASNLCDLQAHFFERFKGMLHDVDEVYVFRFILFSSRKAFDDYNENFTHVRGVKVKPIPKGVLAYYHNQSRTVISYRLSPSDRDGLRGQTYSTIFHEGTHQLRAHYTTGGAEHYDAWTFWWNEGIAEFVAPAWDAEAAKAHKHKFESVHKGRVEEFKRALQFGKWVPLADLLSRPDLESVQSYLIDKFKFQPNEMEDRIAEFTSLFYAEAWSFCYFLQNYENGKYRDAFAQYCTAEFAGDYPHEKDEPSGSRPYLQKLLGIENRAGWDELEKKWIEYVKTL